MFVLYSSDKRRKPGKSEHRTTDKVQRGNKKRSHRGSNVGVACCRGISDARTEDIYRYTVDKKDRTKERKESRNKKKIVAWDMDVTVVCFAVKTLEQAGIIKTKKQVGKRYNERTREENQKEEIRLGAWISVCVVREDRSFI